jgi:hypothetical protein
MQPALNRHGRRRGHRGGRGGAAHTPPAAPGTCSIPEHVGISARFARLEAELEAQKAELGSQIEAQNAELARLHVVVTQHSAAARHMMVLVVAQAASDLEAMLADVSRGAGGLDAALHARNIRPKTFWFLRGPRRTAIAHPPLDGLDDDSLARAAKDAYPDTFTTVWPIIAAFAVERRCVRVACRPFGGERPVYSDPQPPRSPLRCLAGRGACPALVSPSWARMSCPLAPTTS